MINVSYCNLVALIVDLDLAPVNDMAKAFFDVYWLEVIQLENQRQHLDNLSWRNTHIHLRKIDPFYVYPSYCGDLFGAAEQTE